MVSKAERLNLILPRNEHVYYLIISLTTTKRLCERSCIIVVCYLDVFKKNMRVKYDEESIRAWEIHTFYIGDK